MYQTQQKIELEESTLGFTERDLQSKAILNTDMNALNRYKIQKKNFFEIKNTVNEYSVIKDEIYNLRNEMLEIKKMLSFIVSKN
jgi:hypothetical protein